MARARAQRGAQDYIFQRPGSSNFWIKLRSDGKRIEKSLGTSDRAQAIILALPQIAEHKARLLALRPRIEPIWQHRLEPGREHSAPDGGKIIATDKELIHIGHNGSILRQEPNGGPAFQIVSRQAVPAKVEFNAFDAAYNGEAIDGDLLDKRPRSPAPTKTADDVILETYLKHANVSLRVEREARNMWALYKRLTNNKPLKDATRDDGRLLTAHLEAEGRKSASIQKLIGWLRAAVNLAMDEGRLKFNPFASVVPKRDDAERRVPLDDSDIVECKRNLKDDLDAADQLLFRLLATTGMRLSEAFEISGEHTERGIRYCILGNKTDQSLRRVPLPADALPHLPKRITGPLFEGGAPAASKRLNRYLRNCGIADPCKVVHSLRHRAQDRLRAAGCPQDIRWALLGHEEKTVAAGYGEGFPVKLLRKWIDRIGF